MAIGLSPPTIPHSSDACLTGEDLQKINKLCQVKIFQPTVHFSYSGVFYGNGIHENTGNKKVVRKQIKPWSLVRREGTDHTFQARGVQCTAFQLLQNTYLWKYLDFTLIVFVGQCNVQQRWLRPVTEHESGRMCRASKIQRLSVFLTIRSQTESKVWSEIKSTNSWHRNVRKNTSNSKCSTQYLPIIITKATKSWWRQEVGKGSFNVSNCCCRAQSSAASTTRSQEGLVSHVLREYNFLIDKNLFGPQWFLLGPWLKPSGPQKECWSVFNPQIHKQHQWHYRTRGAPKPIYIGIGVSSIGGGAG